MISVRIIFIKTKFNHIKFPIRELKQKKQLCNICKSKQSDNSEYKYKICNTKIQKSVNYFLFEEHWGRKCSYKIFYLQIDCNLLLISQNQLKYQNPYRSTYFVI